MMHGLSRRKFVAIAGASLATSKLVLGQGKKGKLTAGEVVDRVKKNLGIPWIETTRRDTFKVGGPDSSVTGIATCFGTNLRVMQLAVKAGLNMIITHEPTFYSDYDVIDWVKDDPVYKMKLDFATKNNMVVWRIHDDWHARKPDGIREGWDNAMGWSKYKTGDKDSLYSIPPTTVGELAKYVAKTLGSRSVRVMGDPNLRVVTVAHGGHQPEQNMAAMQLKGVDCIIVSETKEYDSFEYVRDAIRSGVKKGAIFVSHVTGEDEGMNNFARWSQPFLPEIPVRYIATTDEYWTV
jgi:putative NIF3 family GTP cyclohydrolase 1 type 2